MKLNWGWGVVLALAGFIGFIMFFFLKAQTMKQDDLVVEEYYDEGLLHDEREVWINNAKDLSSDIEIVTYDDGNVGLILPEELATKKLTGEVKFLRSNNAKVDVIHILNNEEFASNAFPGDKFIRGNYRFKTKLVADGITYYWDRNYIH
jgi:hypothetical protein